MIIDPSEILSCFFAISENTIAHDLKEVENNIKAFREKSQALRAGNFKLRSAEDNALLLHLSLIQSSELCRLPNVPQELKTFYAGSSANAVIENVSMAAFGKDSLKDLNEKMDKIMSREGLSKNQFWPKGSGPDDYEELQQQYDEISSNIENTVFVHTLRRYSMNASADLFENDCREFQIQNEIGRRVVFEKHGSDSSLSAHKDQQIIAEYGKKVLCRIKKRVTELKN